METSRHSALRILTLLMTFALAEIAVGAAQPPTAVSARPCRVVNERKTHFLRTAARRSGSHRISESRRPAGDHGICTGTYTLSKTPD